MYYGFKKGRITVTSLKTVAGKITVDCLCGNKNITINVANLQRNNPTCTICNTQTNYPLAYKSYDSMLQRCLNPKSPDYKNYGGRGITVCSEWKKDFYYFLADMGDRPVGLTLDRIDNNSGYSKENCRWATPKEQANNQRKKNMTFVKGAWQVYITIGGKSTYIGRFKTEHEATVAILFYKGI